MDIGLAEDLTGKVVKGWTVLHRSPRPEGKKWGTFWTCACECGESTRVLSQAVLHKGKCDSCGCRKKKEIQGKIFGKWTILSVESTSRKTRVSCQCECGTIRSVDLASLTIGQSKSCGCSAGHPDRTQAPITKILDSYRRNAEDAGRVWGITRDFAKQILISACYYCGAPPSNSLRSRNSYIFKYSGIDRVDNSGGYTPDNVVPACKICNLAKHAAHKQQFLATVKRVYEHLQLEKIEFPPPIPLPKDSNFLVDRRPRWDHKKRKIAQGKRREAKNNLPLAA